jgi:predicted nucleic acid-binding Zn ribbon protein
MKAHNESRERVLTDLWVSHGCPEKMTIHVKRTGETIIPINGLPVTLTAEKKPLLMPTYKAQKRELRVPMPVTLTRTCEVCKNEFPANRETARFCSARCRVKFNRDQMAEHKRRETESLMASLQASA